MEAVAQGKRVVLRALTLADAPMIAAIRDDPEVARYQSWVRYTEADARDAIARAAATRPDRAGEWYRFGIGLKSDPARLVGDCVMHCPEEDPRQAEIGFNLGRRYWGHGYAAEAVALFVDWLIVERGKTRVFAVTDGRNRAAHRLLEKTGFRRDERFDRMVWFKGEFGPECVWALRHDD